MAARFLKSNPTGSPAPSPTSRSPTPEPSRVSDVRDAARQRSISMSDATPRAAAAHQSLPGLDMDRVPFTSVRTVLPGGLGGVDRAGIMFGGGEVDTSRGLNSPVKDNSLGPNNLISQSGSGRASPSFSSSNRPSRPSQSAYAASISSVQSHHPHRSGSSSGTVPQAIKSLDSFSSKNVAAALVGSAGEAKQFDDVWQTMCIRLLPLFNGEGLKGFVEDLNELVLTHIQRTLARCQTIQKTQSRATPTTDVSSLATGLLTADLSDLISIGCLTLTAKLTPAPPAQSLPDEKFLLRLNELWSFFWTGVLPHLEAVFWVLKSDERLRATTSTAGASGSGRRRTGPRNSAEGASPTQSTKIDARRLALMGFRDHLILPQIERISFLFRDAFDFSSPSSQRSTPSVPLHTPLNRLPPPSPNWSPNTSSYFPHHVTPSDTSTHLPKVSITPSTAVLAANSRRRQMVSILASLLTGDDRQSEMDALLRVTRIGSASAGGRGRDQTSVGGIQGTKHPPRPTLVDKAEYNSEELDVEGGSNPFVATALPPSSPFHISSRPRANTLDSLDEDEVSVYNADGTGASLTPVATARKGKRRGFLPLLGRSKSGSDAAPKPSSGLSSPLFPPDGEYGSTSETPKFSARIGGVPKRHNSMREDSEGTTGSEFEKDGKAR